MKALLSTKIVYFLLFIFFVYSIVTTVSSGANLSSYTFRWGSSLNPPPQFLPIWYASMLYREKRYFFCSAAASSSRWPTENAHAVINDMLYAYTYILYFIVKI